MRNTGKLALLFILVFALNACKSSESTSDASNNTGIPGWYQNSGFESDSTHFSGFATAIAADSMTAISRASAQARAELENHIALKLENIRSGLEENGSLEVIKPEFIVTLRNAHAGLEAECEVTETAAVKFDTYYRGFAKATIQKPALISLLEDGFSEKKAMWDSFQASEMFSAELEN